VISGYINAIGGKDRLEEVKTKTTLLEASMKGITIQVLNKQTNKNKLLVEVSMMGNIMQKIVLNQTKGYNETRGQKMEMKENELGEAIKDAIIFLELEVNEEQIKLKGIVNLNGISVCEVKWSDNKTVYYSTINYYKF
jgi:hypothetical protein